MSTGEGGKCVLMFVVSATRWVGEPPWKLSTRVRCLEDPFFFTLAVIFALTDVGVLFRTDARECGFIWKCCATLSSNSWEDIYKNSGMNYLMSSFSRWPVFNCKRITFFGDTGLDLIYIILPSSVNARFARRIVGQSNFTCPFKSTNHNH